MVIVILSCFVSLILSYVNFHSNIAFFNIKPQSDSNVYFINVQSLSFDNPLDIQVCLFFNQRCSFILVIYKIMFFREY